MHKDLNRIVMIARLTKKPELKYTPSNTAIATYSIANNYSYTQNGEKKETVSFFNCVTWGKLGEIITQYGEKGKQIAVEGRIQQRSWEDANGAKRSTVEVVVENFQFLGGTGSKDETKDDQNYIAPSTDEANDPFRDEDLPF